MLSHRYVPLFRSCCRLPFEGGVLTPSVAGGTMLIDNMRASGLVIEVLSKDYKVDLTRVLERVV